MTVRDRFRQRQAEQGWGVWDTAVNGWHGKRGLSDDEAKRLAGEVNARFQKYHSQPTADGSWRVEPPKPVVVQVREVWREATLDWWVRESDGWHGRVKDSTSGKTEWVHANNIRLAK